MLSCQKHLFRIPDEVTYLNCAYMSPISTKVAAAGIKGIEAKYQPFYIQPVDFFTEVARLKELFAQLIGAEDPQRIALIPSVSYGTATVAANLSLKAGQKILLAGEQFPSNYYPWERLAREQKARIQIIPRPVELENRGRRWNEQILEAIDRDTALVALAHTHWTDGTLFDLEAIRQQTRAVGALLIIDGTQSVGALPFDIKRYDPDALICGAYKWLFGPYGIGLAYYGPHFDQGKPLEENWINRKNSQDFQNLLHYQSEYQALAGRYSMGEQSNFVLVPMVIAAIEQLLEWQVSRIADYALELQRPYLEKLREYGGNTEALDRRGAHLFGVRIKEAQVDSTKLQAALKQHRVMVSQRGDAIRISVNVFNEAKDFERLLACFEAAQR